MKGGVLEKGADGGQTKVACAGTVVAAVLDMIQESADERSVEIVQSEFGRRLVEMFLGKCEKQAERIAVGGDGVRAGLTLAHEALGKKGLKQGW